LPEALETLSPITSSAFRARYYLYIFFAAPMRRCGQCYFTTAAVCPNNSLRVAPIRDDVERHFGAFAQ
jgi:hypothetical protein